MRWGWVPVDAGIKCSIVALVCMQIRRKRMSKLHRAYCTFPRTLHRDGALCPTVCHRLPSPVAGHHWVLASRGQVVGPSVVP